MTGRISKVRVMASIEREDYEVLIFAGWCFSKEIRQFCHASADIYRVMLGRPGLERIIASKLPRAPVSSESATTGCS